MKSFIQLLWRHRLTSIIGLGASIIVFSYLFFSPQSLPSDIQHADKYGHVITFFLLSVLAYKSLNISRTYQILALMGYGVLVECIQHFIPYRSGSVGDVLADSAGIFCFYLLTLIPLWRKLLGKS